METAVSERRRIARETHDIVGHALNVMILSGAAARRVLDNDPQQARELLGTVEEVGRDAFRDLDVALGLTDQSADFAAPKGLADIDELVARLVQAGMQVEYNVEGPARPLPRLVDGSAYRIVQEALTNVAQHAVDARAVVHVRFEPLHAVPRGVRPRQPARGATAMATANGNGNGNGNGTERRARTASACANASPCSVVSSRPGRSPTASPSWPNSRSRRCEMTTPTRVLIVDDDVATRVGLRVIMNAEPDIEVVGESGSAEDAYRQIEEVEPDVVLMDVQLPGADGITATKRITSRATDDDGPRVIVLTTYELDDYVFRSLEAGASGFLLKRAHAEDLTNAVRSVASGNALPTPVMAQKLIEQFAAWSSERRASVDALTDREREVLVLIARGKSNQELARELTISLDTVKSHIRHVFTKLGVRNRAQAVIAAYESGLAYESGVAGNDTTGNANGQFHPWG